MAEGFASATVAAPTITPFVTISASAQGSGARQCSSPGSSITARPSSDGQTSTRAIPVSCRRARLMVKTVA